MSDQKPDTVFVVVELRPGVTSDTIRRVFRTEELAAEFAENEHGNYDYAELEVHDEPAPKNM